MRVARIALESGEHFAVERRDPSGSCAWAVIEDPFADHLLFTGEIAPVEGTPLVAPVQPKVLIGIAHNKTNNDHPLPIQAWHKSVRTVVGPNVEVPLDADVGQVNVEGELAVVIGRPAFRLTPGNALDAVFGYTIANDFTNVDQVQLDEKFFHVKSGRHYAPIGPWIETTLPDPGAEPITVRINGEVRARSSTEYLPSSIVDCLVYVTQWLELGPGDVVLTGAPKTAVGTRVGDLVEIDLPSIGTLVNTITREVPRD